MQFIELFAGAGGMGIGFHQAGMGHELSIEKEEAPHSVLLNSGKTAVRMDLRDVGGFCNSLRSRPDLIAGGPPCQDFSKSGKRLITERAYLTQHFAQTICVVRPEWFVFENVEQAATSRQYQYARALWKRHGYGLTEVVLDAQKYGVPQRRVRFFCIGRLGEIDQFLLDELVASASPKPMVVRDMLDPRRYPEDAELLAKGAFFARPWMGKSDEPNGRGVISIDEVCPTIARNTREYPGESYIKHPKDSAELDDTHILTLDQVARIQGFPPTYDFQKKKKKYARGPGSGWTEKQIQLMIANAVPAPMAFALGKCIFERHYGWSLPRVEKGFTQYLYDYSAENSPKGKSMSRDAAYNVRSNVSRARNMVGGRQFSNIALEIQALEASQEVIWIDKPTRRSELGQRYRDMTVRLRSDLRTALELYHAYIRENREPSKWAPPEPTKAEKPDFNHPPKPPKPKRKEKATPPPTDIVVEEAAPDPVQRERRVIEWPLGSLGHKDPDQAYLESLVDHDFGHPHDPFELQPPRGDPGEEWRPEGWGNPNHPDEIAAAEADYQGQLARQEIKDD